MSKDSAAKETLPNKPKASKPKTNKPKTEEPALINCIFIKSRSEQGYRRCGHGFTPQGAYFAEGYFSEDALLRVIEEPNLIVSQPREVSIADLDAPLFASESE